MIGKKNPATGRRRGTQSVFMEAVESRLQCAAAAVNFSDVRQTMDGFGAQPGWGDNPSPTAYALQVAYSQTSGIGLSYLRGSLSWNGYNQQINMARQAAAYGVQQVMSPRGPAVAWIQDFGNSTNGYLDPAHYQDYANMVADFLENSVAQGIPVYCVSMAVEPDMTTEIVSQWNARQFAALLPYFANTFQARGLTTRIMINEDVGWTFQDSNQILADPSLSQYVDYVAFHAYGQTYNSYMPVPQANGKHVWMSEFFPDSSGTNIQNALSQAVDMYNAITIGGASTYLHAALNWNTGGLMNDWNTPLKNLWAMGNYSKFVRPGWVRVGETDDGGLLLTSFMDPVSGKFAIVAINAGTTNVTETYTLSGLNASTVTPYITSATDDLAANASIAVTGGTFTATIPASSVVTYYGISTSASSLQAPVQLFAAPKSGAQTTQMALSWTDNSSSETAYTVERSTNGTSWTVLTSTLPADSTTYTDSSLIEAATYYYRVKATSGAASSPYSAVFSTSTILAAPSGVSSTSTGTGRNVTWTINSGVSTGVTVQRSTDGLIWTTVATLSTRASSYTDTISGYNSSRIYWYRVRNTLGTRKSAYAQYNTTVAAPTGFSATLNGTNAVTLNWTNNAIGAYAAYIKKNGSAITPANLSATAGTYIATGLTENTTYTFNIQALGADAWFRPSLGVTYGAWSSAATTSITIPVTGPTGLTAISTASGTATLNWVDRSSVETAYQVERSADGAAWTVVTSSLPAGTSSYTDSSAPTTGTVYYRVKAMASSTSSAYAKTLMVSSIPTLTTSATVTGKTTTLTAAAPTGFTGTLTYTWSLDGTPPDTVTYSANGTTAAATSTATFGAAGAYTFRVTIADASGNTTSATASLTVAQTATTIAVQDYFAQGASFGGADAPTPSIAKSTWEQLKATAFDQFGDALANQPSFGWSVISGGGSVNSSGFYSAPANPATPIVRATVGAVAGQLTLNVLATPQLIAGYGFNEGSGYNLSNSGGSSGVTAKMSGGTIFTQGHLGKAIAFDGYNGSVWIGRDDSVDIRGQITMAAWVKLNSSTGTQTILTRGNATNGTVLRIANGQYQVGYRQWDGSYKVAAFSIPAGDVGQWVHLAGTYDGANWNLYRNGALVASYVNARGSTWIDRAWRVGSTDNPDQFFNGAIDSVRLYGTALSASDVTSLYKQTLALTSPASASPATTTDFSTTLSVGAIDPDSNSGSALTYTWSVVSQPSGAANPVFSVNGTAASQSTVVTFTTPGLYQFVVTIADTGTSGQTLTSSVYVVVQGGGSAAPTVAMPASASPSPVTGTTAAVSVLGADDNGAANLSYLWSATGPASVNFFDNGSNSARNTVAIFSAAGSYTLKVQIIDANGLSITSTVNVTVNSTLTTIAVSPKTTRVDRGATQQFSASGLDQFGNAIATSFTWSLASGVGSVNGSGLYTAPSGLGGLASVQATSGAITGTAVIAVPMDNTDASGLTFVGPWTGSTTVGGYFGTNYQYYNTAGGSGSVTYSTGIPITGQYAVYAWWASQSNRNAAVPMDITSASGTTTVSVNQQTNGGGWNLLGTYTFAGGATGSLKVRTPADVDANHSVIADGVLFQLVQAAPSVISPAAIVPANVTGTTAALTALGGGDFGESNLTYNWSSAGPAPVAFAANGTNAAKYTTASFIMAGTYTLTVTISDNGLTTTSAVTVTVNPTLTQLSINPASALLQTGQTRQFTATAYDQFGEIMATPALTWSVTGSGSINSSGLYTAGASGSAGVNVMSGSVSASAALQIGSSGPAIVSPALAGTSNVTGTSTTLNILGTDDGGEASLTYTWSVLSGPSSANFSSNGSNASKNTIVTFNQAGAYTLRATIADAAGLSTTSDVTVTVVQTAHTLKLTPASANLGTNQTRQLVASATDQFGQPINSPAISWSIQSGAGTVTTSGLFTAPSGAGKTIVKATLSSLTATFTATIFAWSPYNLSSKKVSSNTIAVSFKDSTTIETGFQIQVGQRQVNGSIIWMTLYAVAAASGSGSTVNYTIPTAFAAGTWYFRARATSSSGSSNWSNVVSTSV